MTKARYPRATMRRPNPVCDPKTISDNLRKMGEIVDGFVTTSLKKVRSRAAHHDLYLVRTGARRTYNDMIRAGGPVLFLGILQQYDLPAALRAKIEAGSRFYMRRSLPSVPSVNSLERLLAAYKAHYEAAKEAARVGVPHASCSVSSAREMRAGPFRIINTGGFSHATMNEIKNIVEEAAERMRVKGLGAVLYGDISVTNTLHRESTTAFYAVEFDDMFVRANREGATREKVVKTVMHELAHRYDFRVLKNERALQDIFDDIADLADDASKARAKAVLSSKMAPKVGERLGKKHVWEVVAVRPTGAVVIRPVIGGAISMRHKPKRLTLERYFAFAGLPLTTKGGFVTHYASTSWRENFAEMVAYYCLDKLPENQVAMLKKILPKAGVAYQPKGPPPKERLGTLPAAPPRSPLRGVPPPASRAATFARELIATLGRAEAEDYALEQATRNPSAFFVEVYAAFLGANAV